MSDIILGVDYGTGYSNAIFIKEGRFVSALSKQNQTFGVPSAIGFIVGPNGGIEWRNGNETRGEGEGIIIVSPSVKTHLRKGKTRLTMSTTEGRLTVPIDLMKALGNYLADFFDQCVQIPKGDNVVKVVLGYPNNNDARAEEYKEKLESAIKEKYPNAEIIVRSEANLAADLFLKAAPNKFKGKYVLIIDVGAGTTDIAIACWDQQRPKVVDTYSVDFGGENIDKLMRKNAESVFNAFEEDMLGYKKWLFSDGREGKAIPDKNNLTQSMSEEERKELRATIENRLEEQNRRTSSSHKSRIIEAIQSCMQTARIEAKNGIQENELQVVLTGGSSPLPFISEYVEEALSGVGMTKSQYQIRRITDLPEVEKLGITNSNFMACAAAWVGGGSVTGKNQDVKVFGKQEVENMEKKARQAIKEQQPLHGADNIYAIECIDEAYHIIADPEPKPGKNYWITDGRYQIVVGTRQDKPKNSRNWKWDEAAELYVKYGDKFEALPVWVLYRGNNRKPLPEEKIKKSELSEYLEKGEEGVKKLEDRKIECFEGECDDNEGHYIATVYDYDFALSDKSKMQMYLYSGKEGHKCYKSDRQEAITYEEFLRRAKESKNRK